MKTIFVCVTVLTLFLVSSLQAAEIPAVLSIDLEESGGICHANFSPDGKLVTTASKDNNACIWDAATGQKLKTFQHKDWVRFAAFSADGKKIITENDEHIIRIGDVESGKVLKQIEERLYAFSPDRKKIAIAVKIANKDVIDYIFEMKNVAIYIWDVNSVKELYMFDTLKDQMRMSIFSADSKKMATISDYQIIRIWDADSGKKLREWDGGNVGYKVAFSSDGTNLITISEGVYARIWDVQSGKELQKLKGHEDSLLSVAFSPDGKKCATTSSDETARIWDVESGKEILKFQSDPNDRVILPLNNTVMIPRKDGREGYAKIQFNDVLFSPDGKKLLTTGRRIDKTVRIWDVESGKGLYTLNAGEHALTVHAAFSSNGKKVVIFDGGISISVWDLERRITPPIFDF